MNQEHLIFKRLLTAAFTFSIFLGTSAVFAQVKIGTDPTVIDPANNLEVQASTTGRKVKVDKTNGQVTIADGTQGVGKVLTSDANGGASWQKVSNGAFETVRASQTVPIQDNVNEPNTVIVASTELYDPLNAYNTTTGEYTIPVSGVYLFKASGGDEISGLPVTVTRHSNQYIMSAQKGRLSFSGTAGQPYRSGSWNNVVSVNYLNAGDKITYQVLVVHVAGAKPSPATIDFSQIKFSGSRLE